MGAETSKQTCAHVRFMIRRDMPEVLEIEKLSFPAAWSEDDFLRCLRQRNCIGMVAEQGDTIVGFMVYVLLKKSIDIVNFAVHPVWRRKGVGGEIIVRLVNKLSSHRRTSITLAVRETNLPAQLFFRNEGFLANEVVRGFYEDTSEDAILMDFAIEDFTP